MFSVFLRNPKIANPKRGFPYTARRFRRVTWQSRIFVFEPILKGWDVRGAPSGEGRMQSELLETTTNHACPTTSTTRTKNAHLPSSRHYHECFITSVWNLQEKEEEEEKEEREEQKAEAEAEAEAD